MTIAPIVSVLMPVLNEEASVVAAIQSVLNQNVRLEILVADAGSTDGTLACIEALDDERVTVFSNPKRSIPSGLNVALARARGTFVARVDAHAVINLDYLATAIRCFEDSTVGGVGGVKTGVARTPTGRAIAAALSSRFGVGNSVYHYGEHAQDTDHAAFGVYRTSIAQEVGGWDESLAVNEDVDFDYRIMAIGYRIRFEPLMNVSWSVRESMVDFGRQYRRYGRGKAQMVRKNGPAAIKARHLAAPLLVLECGLGAVCIAAGRPKIAVLLAIPYATAITVVAAVSARSSSGQRGRDFSVSHLVSAFLVMHFSWGVGFLENLFLRKSPALASARDEAR